MKRVLSFMLALLMMFSVVETPLLQATAAEGGKDAKEIIAFQDAPFEIEIETKTTLDDVDFPKTLNVQLGDGSIEDIPVTWDSSYDYENTDFSYYVFDPIFDGYEVSATVDTDTIPYVQLHIKNTDNSDIELQNYIDPNPKGTKTLDEVLGCDKYIVSYLKKNASKYLGKPYKGWSRSSSCVTAKDVNSYSAFNCTAFAAKVLKECGADLSCFGKESDSSVYNLSNWNHWLDKYAKSKKICIKEYSSIKSMLKSGDMVKGDIIFFECKSWSGTDSHGNSHDNHIGFFWGNTSKDNKFWHSSHKTSGITGSKRTIYKGKNPGNQISQLAPKCGDVYVYLIPTRHEPELDEVTKSSQLSGSNNINFTITKTDAATGAKLAGAKYDLYKDGVRIIADATTGSNGSVTQSYTYSYTTQKYSVTKKYVKNWDELTASQQSTLTKKGYYASKSKATSAAEDEAEKKAKKELAALKSASHTWMAKEVAPPYGHYMSATSSQNEKSQTLTGKTKSASFAFSNGQQLGDLYISKINSKTNNASTLGVESTLKDAVYSLYAASDVLGSNGNVQYAKDSKVATVYTDANGKASITGLPMGSYYLKEISAPRGFVLNSQRYDITLSAGATTSYIRKDVTVADKEMTAGFELYKTYGTEKLPESNAQFQILNSKSQVVETIKTDANGHAKTSKDLPYGTYTVHQTVGMEHYFFADDFQVVVNASTDGKTITIDNLNDKPMKPRVKFKKIYTINDKDTSTYELTLEEGAEFEIYNEDDNLVDTVTTDKNGVVLLEDYPDGKYTVKQTKGKENYSFVEDFEIEFDSDKPGETVYELDNTYAGSKVKVQKTISKNRTVSPEKGAVFYIVELDKAKQALMDNYGTDSLKEAILQESRTKIMDHVAEADAVLGVLTTDDNGMDAMLFDKDPADMDGYIGLIQGSGADTYAMQDEILTIQDATITMEGTMTVFNFELDDPYDEYGNIAINKKMTESSTKAKAEKDAVFEITDLKTGEVVETLTTDKYGKATSKQLPYGTYSVKQISGVKGHKLSEEFTVKINSSTKHVVQEFELVNEELPVTVSLTKKDSTNQKLLNGAEYTITNASTNEVVAVLVSGSGDNEQGKDSCVLEYGTYNIEETTAPEGYVRDTEKHKFIVNNNTVTYNDQNEAVYKLEFEDTPIYGHIKLDKSGNVLTGFSELESGNNFVYKTDVIPGATYALYAAEDIVSIDGETVYHHAGDLIDTKTTDKNGQITFTRKDKNGNPTEDLYIGHYYVVETKAPYGYVVDSEKHDIILSYDTKPGDMNDIKNETDGDGTGDQDNEDEGGSEQSRVVVSTYEIGATTPSSVIATFYDDGTLAITGNGTMKAFSSADEVPWHADGHNKNIYKLTMAKTVTPTSLAYLCYDCYSLVDIPDFSVYSNITSMAYAFYNCNSLGEVPDISNCANITDMTSTFENCYNLDGKITINASPTAYDNCFKKACLGVVGLELYGTSAVIDEIYNTKSDDSVIFKMVSNSGGQHSGGSTQSMSAMKMVKKVVSETKDTVSETAESVSKTAKSVADSAIDLMGTLKKNAISFFSTDNSSTLAEDSGKINTEEKDTTSNEYVDETITQKIKEANEAALDENQNSTDDLDKNLNESEKLEESFEPCEAESEMPWETVKDTWKELSDEEINEYIFNNSDSKNYDFLNSLSAKDKKELLGRDTLFTDDCLTYITGEKELMPYYECLQKQFEKEGIQTMALQSNNPTGFFFIEFKDEQTGYTGSLRINVQINASKGTNFNSKLKYSINSVHFHSESGTNSIGANWAVGAENFTLGQDRNGNGYTRADNGGKYTVMVLRLKNYTHPAYRYLTRSSRDDIADLQFNTWKENSNGTPIQETSTHADYTTYTHSDTSLFRFSCRNAGIKVSRTSSATHGTYVFTYHTPQRTMYINTRGGSYNGYSGDPLTIGTLTCGTSNYYAISAATRTGYQFLGYYDGSGRQIYNSSGYCVNDGTYWSGNVYQPNSDLWMDARWSPNTYYVRYNGNGATSGSMSNSTHTYDSWSNLSGVGYSKYGYSFAGWNTAANGTGSAFGNGASVVNLTSTNGGTVDLYAQWSPNQYSLTLNPNGGSFSDGSTSAKTLSPNLIFDAGNWWNIGVPDGISRNGYILDGWYDSATGGEKVYDASGECLNGTYWNNRAYKYAGNLTVYARWIPVYKVSYNGNGATGGSTATSNHTGGIEAPLTKNGFTKKGYEFRSWNTKADGTGTDYADEEYVNNLTTVGGSTVTLYAQWGYVNPDIDPVISVPIGKPNRNDVIATLYRSGRLEITGTGDCDLNILWEYVYDTVENKTADEYKVNVRKVEMEQTVKPTEMNGWFDGCVALRTTDIYPDSMELLNSADQAFKNCYSLQEAPNFSWADNLNYLKEAFMNCYNLQGELIINSVPTSYADALNGANLSPNYLFLSGSSSTLPAIYDTRTTGNNIVLVSGNAKLISIKPEVRGFVVPKEGLTVDNFKFTGTYDDGYETEISLYDDNVTISPDTAPNEEGNFNVTFTFTGPYASIAPVTITVKAQEIPVPDNDDVTEVNYNLDVLDEPQMHQIMVKKTDVDGNPLAGAQFQMKALINILDYQGNIIIPAGTVIGTETSDEDGYVRFDYSLPTDLYAAGTGDLYQIAETVAPKGYKLNSQVININGEASNNTTQIFQHESTVINESMDNIVIKKIWAEDYENAGNTRPDSITVYIYRDGNMVKRVTLTSENDWTLVTDLPKTENGQEIAYTCAEASVPVGYADSYKPLNNGILEITNTYEGEKPQYTSRTVKKAWSDNNNSDGLRPSSVKVNLLADGVVTSTVTLSASNSWTYTYNNLAIFDSEGNEINYTFEEVKTDIINGDKITGYSIKTEKSGTTTTITNTHTPIPKKVTVKKEWDDENDKDQIRPSSVSVNLLADGVVKQTVTLSASNNWYAEATNLPRYSGGKEIQYQWREVHTGVITGDEETGYKPTYAIKDTDTTITNTHKLTVPSKIIYVTKRIKADDINFSNGNPSFIFKVHGTDMDGNTHTYYGSMTFTEEYVDQNTDNDGYVSIEYKFDNLFSGVYTVSEEIVSRYRLQEITDVVNGTITDNGKTATIDLTDRNTESGAATFTNDKYEWQGYTDTDMVINHFGQ